MITLEQYEAAERELAVREGRIGLMAHAIVTLGVWVVVVVVNVLATPDFPWCLFVIAGTGVGVFFHWFGYHRAEDDLRRRQEKVEARARMHATLER
jgi:hypothetical protein